MARRLLYAPDETAAMALADLVKAGQPKKRSYSVGIAKAREELDDLIAHGEYEKMKPKHLVALWMRCHEKVYGVTPVEPAKSLVWATNAAKKLVNDEFGGSVVAAVEFMRWTWQREQWRETKAKHDGEVRVGNIGWRIQFVLRYLLTDYRIDRARRRAP
jgi:hypothetical protein